MQTTTNMGLVKWNLATDLFSHGQLSANFQAIDTHDHSSGKGVPVTGIATNAVGTSQIIDGSVTNAKLAGLSLQNSKLDPTTVTAPLGLNDGTSVRRGKSIIAGTGTRTNAAYGFLNDANDRVQNVVLPTDGLIFVAYQATWQESAAGAARAAIFIGVNQQLADVGTTANAQTVAAATSGPGSIDVGLFSHPLGLGSSSQSSGTYTESTTGVAIGQTVLNGKGLFWEVNGSVVALGPTMGAGQAFPMGGPCSIFAAAGTYDVSVQFKASGGNTVTAKNRKLWVWTMGF